MGGVGEAHPVGEVHFHSKDTDILWTRIGRTVKLDTVGGGHFWKMIGRGRE